jgi:hypothetical protein
MSLVLQKAKLIQSIPTGIHLVIINDIQLLKTELNTPVYSKNGELCLVVEFLKGDLKRFQQMYWIGKDRQFMFDKLCATAGIDNTRGPLSKKVAIGKRVWICVREEYSLVNDVVVPESKEYRVFRTYPVMDVDSKPAVAGDPERNGGQPSGDFIFYKQTEDGSN